MPRKMPISIEQMLEICAAIEAGVSPWAAVCAAGATWATHQAYMDATKRDSADAQDYRRRVNQAIAVARGAAEARVYEKDPSAWLMKSPVRKPQEEGDNAWNDPPKEMTVKTTVALAPPSADLSKLSFDELDALERILTKAAPSLPAPADTKSETPGEEVVDAEFTPIPSEPGTT